MLLRNNWVQFSDFFNDKRTVMSKQVFGDCIFVGNFSHGWLTAEKLSWQLQ